MTPHCDFCAHPHRAVLVSLARQGLRPSVISRHYRMPQTSVTKVLGIARKRGCLGASLCPHCKGEISTRRVTCLKSDCMAKANSVRRKNRRATFGWAKGRPKAQKDYRAPPAFIWPVLPPSPRGKNGSPGWAADAPLKKPQALFGTGNRGRAARLKARSAAGFMLPSAEVAVLPWRAPVAPPLCPTIGSLHHARMAA